MTAPVAAVDPITLAVDIVSAYAANNSFAAAELPGLLQSVHAALTKLVKGEPAEPATPSAPTSAVSLKKSITPDYLICLDDGLKFKSLKRHIGQLGMTPEHYRTKWSLPSDYPMMAPAYAAQRSALAKKIGLGQKRKAVVVPAKKPSRPAKAKAAE